MIRRHPVRAHPRKVAGVAAVQATDHYHQINRLLGEQSEDRILSVLGRAADGIERAETKGKLDISVAVAHGRPEHFPDLERLRTEHRRLVGATHALQVTVRIEPRRGAVLEARQDLRAAAAGPDIAAHDRRFVTIKNDQVSAATRMQGLRCSGSRLLVPVLPVNDGREALLRVPPHVLPHVQHRAAGRIHQRAAALL